MKKIALLLLLIIAFIIFLIVSGCNTYQKRLNQFNTFADQNKPALAAKCTEYFPVTEHQGAVSIDSIHKANNTNYQSTIDSLKNDADLWKQKAQKDTAKSNPCAPMAKGYLSTINSLTAKIDVLQNKYRPCKSDTIFKTQTVYQVDNAALAVVNNSLKVATDSIVIYKERLKVSESKASGRLKWIFILGGIIAVSVLGTVLKILGKI